MEKITASKLMLCAAALMAISGILLELSVRFVHGMYFRSGAVHARCRACFPHSR